MTGEPLESFKMLTERLELRLVKMSDSHSRLRNKQQTGLLIKRLLDIQNNARFHW